MKESVVRRPPLPRIGLSIVLAFLTTLAGVATSVAPASADPLLPSERPLAVIGSAQVEFFHNATEDLLEVRLTGEIPASTRITGAWTAILTGHEQQTVTSLPAPVFDTWGPSSAYTLNERFYFATDADYGSITVDLSYTAAGSYVVARSIHTIEWNPLVGMNTAGVDVG